MNIDEIIAKMNDALASTGPLEKSIKLDMGEDGQIFAHGVAAVAEDRDADCTIKISKKNFLRVVQGEMNPMTGFLTNKIKVTGDMSVALGLQKLFAGK